MHHYGRRQLALGANYKLHPDPNNKYDSNAVAVKDEGRTVAYLRRNSAKALTPIFQESLPQCTVLLKCKEDAQVHTQKMGPEQKGIICIALKDSDVERTADYLRSKGIHIRIVESRKE